MQRNVTGFDVIFNITFGSHFEKLVLLLGSTPTGLGVSRAFLQVCKGKRTAAGFMASNHISQKGCERRIAMHAVMRLLAVFLATGGGGGFRAGENMNLQILARQNLCHVLKMSEQSMYGSQ